MNAMNFTGKTLALCVAAGIAAAAFGACGNKADNTANSKQTEAGKKDASEQTQTTVAAAEGQKTAGKDLSDGKAGTSAANETAVFVSETADVDTAEGAVTMEEDFSFEPATEAEVLELLYFLPDPLAKVNGEPLPRSLIIDGIVEQEIPIQILQSLGEEKLRDALSKEVANFVKDKVMLILAEEAGFKPSAEFLEKEIRAEFDELPEEEQTDLKESIKAHEGKTIEEFIKEKAQDTEMQEIVALRKYTHTTFLEKAKKEISDEAIKKEYEDHIAELTMPEGVTVAHILIQPDDNEEDSEKADKEAKAKIDAIYEELLKDPEQFGKLAEEKSDCPSGKRDQGALPAFDKDGMMLDGSGAMDQTFTDAAFTIEEDGAFTKPVKTRFGYHIIKRISKSPSEVIPLEKVRDVITEHLAVEKAKADLDKTIEEATKKYAEIMEFVPPKADEAKADEAKAE